MAVTIIPELTGMHRKLYTITFTANGDADIVLPDKPIAGIIFQSDGVDGGGTLSWHVSADGNTYNPLGVNTVADPVSQTAVLSATAAGAWIAPVSTLGFRAIRFTLANSTNPTLVVLMHVTYRI